MFRGRRHRLLAVLIALSLITTACLDEIGQFLQIIVWDESGDPMQRSRAEWHREREKSDEAFKLRERYLGTGDVSALHAALEVRPHDENALALLLIRARKAGDEAAIADYERRLAYANAMPDPDDSPGDARPSRSARSVQEAVNGDVLKAQLDILGHSIWDETWEPPGPGAPADEQQQFQDYCATRADVRAAWGDGGSKWWQNGPPCP